MQGRNWAWAGVLALAASGCAPETPLESTGVAALAEAPAQSELGAASAALQTGTQVAGMAAVYARPRSAEEAQRLSGTNPKPTEPAPRAPEAVRPEAQVNPITPPPEPPALAPVARSIATADLAKGRALFSDNSCGACHALAAAGAAGGIGPGFDNRPGLEKAFLVDRITNGAGAMPAFGGQISDADIALLADYILAVGKR